jgi:assimilatory nitrate reductase catalytic subunit
MQALTPRTPANAASADYPLVLNTGRVRDHWHTMTRTARAAKLNAHQSEPLLHVHPRDAARHALRAGEFARLASLWGEALLRVQIDDSLRPGNVFVPMHWSEAFAAQAGVGKVINPDRDPVSGQPEFKHTPVSVQAVPMTWHGFLIRRAPLSQPPQSRYWARIPATACTRYELADEHCQPETGAPTLSIESLMQRVFAEQLPVGERLEWGDPARAAYRAAWLQQGRLEACLFIAPSPHLPDRLWLQQLFDKHALSTDERRALLSGQPPRGSPITGAIVCACFAVGEQTLRRHIRSGCRTPAALTRACQAGGNCGSCLPALQRLIDSEPVTGVPA